ncbi:WD40 repeat-containing protein SMU1 [Sarcoptes scabiei]|nr:WD40 repeat-containing protein SMU1 [Sarcoptes scabiei]
MMTSYDCEENDRNRLVQNHLERIRGLLEIEFRNETDKYHPIDIERIRNDDWQIIRYFGPNIIQQSLPKQRQESKLSQRSSKRINIEEIFQKIINTLRWKRMNGINDMQDKDFPREFFLINNLEILGRDPDDNTLIVWTCSRYTKEFADLKFFIKQFAHYEMNRLDSIAGRFGCKLITDAQHSTLLNIDIEMNQYSNWILETHFPGFLRQNILFNLSSLLGPIVKLILNFMDENTRQMVRIIHRRQLSNFIDKRFIPKELGGERTRNSIRLPEECRSYKEILGERLSSEQISRYDALLQKIFSK